MSDDRSRSSAVRDAPRHARHRRDARLPARRRRRRTTAARARLARDAPHLVAQRRAARGGRLRGDRAGPARLRRQRPRARRPLRRRRVRDRPARPRARRARPRHLLRRRRRRGRTDRLRPVAAVPGVRPEALLLQHGRAGARQRRVRSRRHPARRRPRVPGHRRLLPPAGDRRRRARGGAGHSRAPACVRRRDVRPPALGRPDRVLRRRSGLHDRAVRRRGPLPGEHLAVRERDREPPDAGHGAVPRDQSDADARALRAGGPRGAAQLPGPLCGGVHRVRGAVRGPGRRALPAVGGGGHRSTAPSPTSSCSSVRPLGRVDRTSAGTATAAVTPAPPPRGPARRGTSPAHRGPARAPAPRSAGRPRRCRTAR